MPKTTLTQEQEIVLSVVQEFLDQNRPFEEATVVPYIQNQCTRNSINLNKEGIKTILQGLVRNYYVVQGSKLNREKILENQNRRKLFNLIKSQPGIYFNRLIRRAKLANHVVSWHLNVLMKFKCIEKNTIENHEVYYLSSVKFYEVKKQFYLSKRKGKEIMHYFNAHLGEAITKSQLERELNTHYNTISKYVDSFSELDILTQEKLENSTNYYLYDEIEL